MRISIFLFALFLVFGTACTKSTPPPASGVPVQPVPDPMQDLDKPDDTKYPLIGDYAWRVVSLKMVRGKTTTLNNWDLNIKFSPNNARYTYNGGAVYDYPTAYNGDTVKITFKVDSTVIFWKSMHAVDGKYEWHLEGANCHCQSGAETYDVYELRR